MKHNLSASFKKMRGLTLMEMMIAISLVVMLVSAVSSTIDTDRKQATEFLAKSEELRTGMLRLYTDFPCGVTKLSALALREDAVDNFCGTGNDLNRWNGPYIDPAMVLVNGSAVGAISLDRIYQGSSAKLVQVTSVAGTKTLVTTILELEGVPDGMKNYMWDSCGDTCKPWTTVPNPSADDLKRIGLVVKNAPAAVGMVLQEVVPLCASGTCP